MPPSSSRTSTGAVLGAIALGFVLAILANAVLVVIFDVIFNSDVGLGMARVLNALISVIVGVAAAAPLFLTRPSGPLAPILAGISALVGGFIGVLIGIGASEIIIEQRNPSARLEIYLETLKHMDAIGAGSWLLSVLVAAGLAALRVMTAKSSGRQQPQGPWGGPQPAFGQPQPGQYGQPAPPYGQPGQYGPPPAGQPGQYGPPGTPGQPPPPGQYGQPAPPAGQPGQFAPPGGPGQPPPPAGQPGQFAPPGEPGQPPPPGGQPGQYAPPGEPGQPPPPAGPPAGSYEASAPPPPPPPAQGEPRD
ncbi:hypothetical protein [Actinomadura sp. 9N407]|uniref:hypothetical protein n=1 Tax=Actinomadura sp. 9N407 TaxID=3375154 RepID=UPI0037B21370